MLCRSFLRSLDPRNISNGAAEILKMACIKDEDLFNVLDEHAEQLRSSSFQVTSTSATAGCPSRLLPHCSPHAHVQPCPTCLTSSHCLPNERTTVTSWALLTPCAAFQDKEASVAMRRSIQGMLEELDPNQP